jgi:hypothetical protein
MPKTSLRESGFQIYLVYAISSDFLGFFYRLGSKKLHLQKYVIIQYRYNKKPG